MSLPPLDLDDLKRLERGALFERAVGDVVTKELSRGGHAKPEYCAVAVKCALAKEDIQSPCHLLLDTLPQVGKRMYSLNPVLECRPAPELKQEMMERYATDGYHFLENHIDYMMTPSDLKLLR